MYFLAILIVVTTTVPAVVSTTCPLPQNAITMEDVQNAAYASKHSYDDNLLEGNLIPDTNFSVTIKIHDELQEDGEGIRVIVADNGNTRMIVYRGTDGFEQLLAEGSSGLFGKEQEWTVDGVKTEILTFFYNAYQLASFQLRPYINDPSKKYILTGHSLGGALASILALDSTQLFEGSVWKNPKSCLITFGQPRIGGSNFAMVHDRLISTFRKLRFVYNGDPVPRLPPYSLGWRHHSRAVYIRGVHRVWDKRSLTKPHTKHFQADSFINRIKQQQQQQLEVKRNIKHDHGHLRKRFLWGKENYWQVCGLGDSRSCTLHWYNVIPRISHHSMSNSYLNSVTQSPTYFLTNKDIKKSGFTEALVASCL